MDRTEGFILEEGPRNAAPSDARADDHDVCLVAELR